MTPNHPHSPLPSPSTFDDIHLSPFPKHLPLRPSKPSRLRTFLRHPVARTLLLVMAWLILLAGITVAAMFIGKAVANARMKSEPAQRVVSTPVVRTTVVVTNTQSSVVVSTVDEVGATGVDMEIVRASATG
jgi:uncharacterized protein (DUF58 family)